MEHRSKGQSLGCVCVCVLCCCAWLGHLDSFLWDWALARLVKDHDNEGNCTTAGIDAVVRTATTPA